MEGALGGLDGWVADGNYMRKLGTWLVFDQADTIVFLDLPLSVCLRRMWARTTTRIRDGTELWGTGNRETWANFIVKPNGLLFYTLRTHRRHRRAISTLAAGGSSGLRPKGRGRSLARSTEPGRLGARGPRLLANDLQRRPRRHRSQTGSRRAPLGERVEERGHDRRVELGAGAAGELRAPRRRTSPAYGPVRDHRVEGVADGDDPGRRAGLSSPARPSG